MAMPLPRCWTTSQPPQRDDLLFDLFAQDVTHIVGGYRPRARVNVLNEGLSLAGFQVIMYGRFWVITEAAKRFCSLRRDARRGSGRG
jgi:hypothetical protein